MIKSYSNHSINFDNYLNNIDDNICVKKKTKKIDGEIENMPTYDQCNLLMEYNYNLKQLKQIAKYYKLKISGNKSELTKRIYSYLHLSNKIINIQKCFRGFLHRKYVSLHGPAFKNRQLCTNSYDFLSMEELTNIEYQQFFSFKDEDGFIYGFDILSFYNLLNKNKTNIKNPFSTKIMSPIIISNFRKLIKMSRMLKIKVVTELNDVNKEISEVKSYELRVVSLFQAIDALGHYSNSNWFLSLSRNQLLKFIRELEEIWNYRAHLDHHIKHEICPPYGNPFSTLPGLFTLSLIEDTDIIRKSILTSMENMVYNGINDNSKNLGAFYVLGALTLVNNDAATALSWLHEAVCYNM